MNQLKQPLPIPMTLMKRSGVCIYKSYHSRENISYVELDEGFIKAMMKLKKRLIEAKTRREKKREAQKRYYEKNREKILSEKKRRTKGGKSV